MRAELGGPEALRRLWEALDRHGLGQVVDLVPNHMGIRSPRNRWWWDLLRGGRASRYAGHFDVEWDPPDPGSRDRVVLPFLAAPLPEVLARGELGLVDDDPAARGAPADLPPGGTPRLVVAHHGDRWPLSDESVAALDLPTGARRDGAVRALATDPGRMAALLERQHWRAVHWREAGRLLNWRRFFDVTDLAAVRVDRPEVFDEVHALLRRWLDDDLGGRVVQGVRIDHVDGLTDPGTHLERVRALLGHERLLVVEKILATDELLPSAWPVDGTTGYEVLTRIDRALTDGEGAARLRADVAATTGAEAPFAEVERACRRLVVSELLEPEADRLGRAFAAARAEIDGSAPPTEAVHEAASELALELDVYRVYPSDDGDHDRRRIDAAAARVGRHRPELAPLLADAHDLLTGERAGPAALAFADRFAQLTAPLAAKATEDTAFYRELAVPWLAEVGGDPTVPGTTPSRLHAELVALGDAGPGTLVPLTTHDTKRSGDVRARLGRLAEASDQFAVAVADWHRRAARLDGIELPDPGAERLVWLTLVGAWPISPERVEGYLVKALREAKDRTSWLRPDPDHEGRVVALATRALADRGLVDAIESFVARIRRAGRAASLVQVVVAATAVGAPDLYQGDELWNLSLVDPDNRRPVDHARRARLLDDLDRGPSLAERWRNTADDPDDDGAVKLGVWRQLLALRRDRPEIFHHPYRPHPLEGPGAGTHLAYQRGDDLAVVVPLRTLDRLEPATLELRGGPWHDVLTARRVPSGVVEVDELLAELPVAVLTTGGAR